MKKTLIYGAATAAVALSLTACRNPVTEPATLYGPPPQYDNEEEEPISDLYGPPVEHDEDEALEALYGPAPED